MHNMKIVSVGVSIQLTERDPSASARQDKRAEAMLHLKGLTRQEYTNEEVTDLIEKIRNGLGTG